MGTNATSISAASRPNRVRRGPASYDDGLEAHSDARPAHACVRPSCPSCPVPTTVHEEHFPFNVHLTLDSGPFHSRYDLRGNLTKKYREDASSTIYTDYHWDSRNKMTKVYDKSSDKTVQYMYDFAGRRVAKKVDSGQWWWYFYDGLNVVAEGVASGNKAYYTNASGGPGGIICRDENGTKLWYHFDRLGNVMAVTDSSGNAYAVYTMDAFGNVLEKGTSTGYASEHATDPQPYHLTTKEYDDDIDLYFYMARWYDPEIGRWISRDPLGRISPAGGILSPYAYCINNPANAIDADGNIVWAIPIGMLIAGVTTYLICIWIEKKEPRECLWEAGISAAVAGFGGAGAALAKKYATKWGAAELTNLMTSIGGLAGGATGGFVCTPDGWKERLGAAGACLLGGSICGGVGITIGIKFPKFGEYLVEYGIGPIMATTMQVFDIFVDRLGGVYKYPYIEPVDLYLWPRPPFDVHLPFGNWPMQI